MASVTAYIRTTKKKADMVHLRFRLRTGRALQLFHKSEIEVPAAAWDGVRQEIRAKAVFDTTERVRINRAVVERKNLLLELFEGFSGDVPPTSEWLEEQVDRRLNPENYAPIIEHPQTFFEAFEEFLQRRKLSDWRIRGFQVVIRMLRRYELYKQLTGQRNFALSLDEITPVTLQDFEKFLREEHLLAQKFPQICVAVPDTRRPKQRGQNTINGILTKVRTFFIWAVDVEKTTNNPFKNFQVQEDVYGTPYYLSIDERNQLYHTDLLRHPALAVQRDIFVFQCLVGCRVSDLYRMTKHNLINGAIEYIAQKTRDGRPVTLRVPLNTIAREILDRYPDGEGLFPFIAEQKYNLAIKRVLLAARLTRPVTIINPTTRQPQIRPLNEIASSHMARRSFVGNLYKQVKDPNLVGALSGHKEGSRAFARYREIDEQIKQELVRLLE